MTGQKIEIPAAPEGGRICVVGAGFMGCVIAALYAWHGYYVTAIARSSTASPTARVPSPLPSPTIPPRSTSS